MRQAYDYWQDQPDNLHASSTSTRSNTRESENPQEYIQIMVIQIQFHFHQRLDNLQQHSPKRVITKAVVVESINNDLTVKTKDVLPQNQKTYIVTKG